MLRALTDRGTEYCGKVEQHGYQLHLVVNDIDHTRTKAQSPQTNRICERFHNTILNEFFQLAFCKKIYTTIESMQGILTRGPTRTTMSAHIKEKCAVGERRVVAVERSDQCYCSDSFEICCDNDERVNVVCSWDCCDRQAIAFAATTAGVSSELVRNVMIQLVRRFGPDPQRYAPVDWLSDNGSGYIA